MPELKGREWSVIDSARKAVSALKPTFNIFADAWNDASQPAEMRHEFGQACIDHINSTYSHPHNSVVRQATGVACHYFAKFLQEPAPAAN